MAKTKPVVPPRFWVDWNLEVSVLKVDGNHPIPEVAGNGGPTGRFPSETSQGKAEERRDQRADGSHPESARWNRRADQREVEQREKRSDHKQTRQKEANQPQLEERQEWTEQTDTREKGEPQRKTKERPHPTLIQLPNPGRKRKEEQKAQKRREARRLKKRKRSKEERKEPADAEGEASQ